MGDEHRMYRCRFDGQPSDALDAVLAAVRYNLRWLILRIDALLAAIPVSLQLFSVPKPMTMMRKWAS